MKLYHCTGARSLRPLWLLEEMGLEYELEVLPFPPRVKAKWFKEINPLGTVPCFITSDATLTESSAICQYLVDRHPDSSLGLSAEHPEYGAYLNWLYRSDSTFTFPQTLYLRYEFAVPDEMKLPEVANDYKKWFLARISSVESALGDGRQYLCAGRFTIADICVGYAIYLSIQLKIAEVMTPNIKNYWRRLEARPAFQRAISNT